MSTPETAGPNPGPTTTPAKKISQQMRSVMTILAADEGLFDLVSPFINYMEESIKWEQIFALPLSSGHKAVIEWAFICWRDEVQEGSNPFSSILNCDANFRRAIVRGLSVRWGISK